MSKPNLEGREIEEKTQTNEPARAMVGIVSCCRGPFSLSPLTKGEIKRGLKSGKKEQTMKKVLVSHSHQVFEEIEAITVIDILRRAKV